MVTKPAPRPPSAASRSILAAILLVASSLPAPLASQTTLTARVAALHTPGEVGEVSVRDRGFFDARHAPTAVAFGVGLQRALGSESWSIEGRLLVSASVKAASLYRCVEQVICLEVLETPDLSVRVTSLSVGVVSPSLGDSPFYLRGGGHLQLRRIGWPEGVNFTRDQTHQVRPGVEAGAGARLAVGASQVRLEVTLAAMRSDVRGNGRIATSVETSAAWALPLG